MATRGIPLVVKPLVKHTSTVIFMHGLGDSGHGWLDVAQMLNKTLPHVKWLLPHASSRPITINGGFVMPAWFDLYSLDKEEKGEDHEGLLTSARTIDKYIQDEIDGGIPAERIVVGGFSQGGAMSLLVGLTSRGDGGLFGGRDGWKLGGVVVLSGMLPLRDEFRKMVSPHLTKTPILMCHGTDDPLIPCDWARETRKFLINDLGIPALDGEGKLGGAGLSFRTYESLGHSACPQELEDLAQFLRRVLP